MSYLLDAGALGEVLEGYHRDLFRMETLPEYAVGDDYLRWVAGENDPESERKREWMDVLRADRDAGKHRRRVRVLSEKLTDYEHYSCAWGYALNADAGEDIRVLHRGEHDVPECVAHDLDFWVVDGRVVVKMHYDARREFVGAEVFPEDDEAWTEVYLEVRDHAWNAAEPFATWWARYNSRTVAAP